MAKSLLRRALGWAVDRGAEKVYQDNVVTETTWQRIKSAIPALLGTVSMTTILSWLLENWIPAIAGGVLAYVILIYVTAIIRVWRMGKALPTTAQSPLIAASQVEKPAATTPAIPPVPVAPKTTCLHAPKARFDIDAIGLIRSVEIKLHFKPRVRWECLCHVDFCALREGTKVSPRQLLLTEPGGDEVIAILGRTSTPVAPGSVTYKGWSEERIRWKCLPENGQGDPIFCAKVEIRIPLEYRDEHNESGVRLDYELVNSGLPADRDHRTFFVEVVSEPADMDDLVKALLTAGSGGSGA